MAKSIVRGRIAIALILVLGLVVSLGTAQAGKVFATTIDPSGFTFFNPCTGETVTIDGGRIRLQVNANANNGGGFQISAHVNGQGVRGTGNTSGAKYQIPISGHLTLNVNGAGVFTLVLHLAAVSQGNADNLDLKLLLHVTVNANGDVTAANLDFDAECRG